MKLTITYRPQTLRVPNWAVAQVRELLAAPQTRATREQLQELLDDLTEANEIPYPEAETVQEVRRCKPETKGA